MAKKVKLRTTTKIIKERHITLQELREILGVTSAAHMRLECECDYVVVLEDREHTLVVVSETEDVSEE